MSFVRVKIFYYLIYIFFWNNNDIENVISIFETCIGPLSQETDSLEAQAEPAVLCTYVENQAILEPILIYRASKCKQTKEQGSEDCLWTDIFTFL